VKEYEKNREKTEEEYGRGGDEKRKINNKGKFKNKEWINIQFNDQRVIDNENMY